MMGAARFPILSILSIHVGTAVLRRVPEKPRGLAPSGSQRWGGDHGPFARLYPGIR